MPAAESMGTDTSPCAKGTDLFFPMSAACCHKTFRLCVRRTEGRRRGGGARVQGREGRVRKERREGPQKREEGREGEGGAFPEYKL